jgi:hypothetical protein
MPKQSAAVVKVPLWGALREAIRRVLGDLKAVGKAGWRPFVALTLFGVATQVLYENGFARTVPAGVTGPDALRVALPIMLLVLVALVVQTLTYNAFMVSWYRHLLGSLDSTGSRSGYWRAFWRSLGYYVLTLIGFIVFTAVVSVVIGIVFAGVLIARRTVPADFTRSMPVATLTGIAIASIVFFMCFARTTLVFPAAACGSSLGFRLAWRKTRGNTWRLIAAILLVTIAYFVVALAFAFATNGAAILSMISGTVPRIPAPQPFMLVFATQLVGRFIVFLFLALTTSIAAIFYRELVLRPGDVAEVFA